MFDWNDLRVFLAAARETSLNAGAKRLGLDPATVGRRIARLETALKSTLFVRSAGGLRLTASGARLLEIGSDAERAMEAAERMGADDVIGGTVRLSVSEGFGVEIIAPALPALLVQHRSLRVELAANAGFLSPMRREVDLAVTLSAPTESRLVVEPLTAYQLGLYASRDYLKWAGSPQSAAALKGHMLVGYVEDMIYAPELAYLDEVGESLRPALSSSSIQAQREIIRAGGGIGVLPCFMGSGLTRLLPDEVTLERRFWISTHRDVAGTARVRALRRWIQQVVAARASALGAL